MRAGLGDKPKHTEGDQKSIWRRTRGQSERHADCVTLRRREEVKPVEQGSAQVLKSGERELRLGSHANSASDPQPVGTVEQVLQQRRLTDTWLASQHQDAAALPVANLLQQLIQYGALTLSAMKRLGT